MQTPIRLDIVKGVAKAVNDTESAEQGVSGLSLLDSSGIALDANDGWRMKNASLKRGGVWTESPVQDGRQLIAAADANVVETFNVHVANPDLHQRQAIIKKLQQFKKDAEDFWTTGYQIEPVYLAFQAAGAAAEQFALIYTLTIDSDNDPFDCANTWSFTLSVEREPAWRMVIPPGGNPILYTFWKQGKIPGVDFDYNDLVLSDNTNHLAYDTIDGRFEWAGGGSDRTGYLSKNWIDIDAEDIPGDAPALVNLTLEATTGTPTPHVNTYYLARTTKPRTYHGRVNGIDELAFNIFQAADAASATTDTCGVYANDQVVNQQIVSTSILASAGWTEFLRWDQGNLVDPTAFFGNWAVFLRCQQTSGSQGDVRVRFKATIGEVAADQVVTTLDEKDMPAITPGASCAEFRWIYLGQLTFPPSGLPVITSLGVGSIVGESTAIADFVIECRNTVASNRNIEFLDLALMPVDEHFMAIEAGNLAVPGIYSVTHAAYDNTGYMTHGRQSSYAASIRTSDPLRGVPLEIRGQDLTLEPGKDNRLYLIANQIGAFVFSYAAFETTMRLNIVPRCYGIATVEPNP